MIVETMRTSPVEPVDNFVSLAMSVSSVRIPSREIAVYVTNNSYIYADSKPAVYPAGVLNYNADSNTGRDDASNGMAIRLGVAGLPSSVG